ncbi:MAG: type II secretion system F family protein [Thermodesulfobacteriota bacterium]
MPVFEYTAINAGGKNVNGIIDADNLYEAREKLRATSLFPTAITEAYDTRRSPRKQKQFLNFDFFSGVRARDLTSTTRQLATLVGAGFPLVSAIYALIPQTTALPLKRVLSRIKDSIEEGNSFAEALTEFPDIFPSLFVNMVRAGEASGTLEIVLERLAEINENRQVQKNRIISILAYPAVMTVLGFGILTFLLVSIVPEFISIFSDMKHALPLPTRIIQFISTQLASYWWILLVVLIAIYAGFNRLRKTARGGYLIDKTVLRLPGISILATKIAVARFSRTLGSLLENGIPMLTALDIVKNIVGNTIIAEAVQSAGQQVEKGMGLGISLEEAGVFPPLSVQMIKVGEQSGDLEKMLLKTADVFENEVESTLVGLTSILQPLLVVFMGVIIMFIVLAIILPIFEMNQMVG